ncbi:hypothetical protein V1287_000397 [Bradyrhizobium sp. AZCC 1699]
MSTLDHFLQKKHVNHEQALNAVANRFAVLIVEADLAAIRLDHFRTLCQLLDGSDTLAYVSGKALFASAIQNALNEQHDFREEIVGVKFANDTPENRAAFMAKLDVEREHLEELITLVRMFSETQALALLERVEEVLSTSDELLEHKCNTVFKKMQTRSQL